MHRIVHIDNDNIIFLLKTLQRTLNCFNFAIIIPLAFFNLKNLHQTTHNLIYYGSYQLLNIHKISMLQKVPKIFTHKNNKPLSKIFYNFYRHAASCIFQFFSL